MTAEQYLLPDDFAGEVRLFPLPDLVLFPSNVLPLHIFESRYCEMLEDAIQGDRLIAMATLEPGHEPDYHSRPPLAPMVCVGRLTSYEQNEQGTYHLILFGIQRARIEYEIEPVRSFRRAHVQVLQDRCHEPDATGRSGIGRELAERIRVAMAGAEKLVEGFDQGHIPLAALTDILAFHLSLDIGTKLKLLGEVDVVARAQLLLESVPSRAEAQRTESTYPGNFSDN